MATSEEKQELVENLKGPHYYRITVSGYGAETAYVKLNKAAFDFWKESLESGDGDLITYCTNSEDYTTEQLRNGELEFEEIDPAELSDEVCFLHDEPEEVGSSWYEAPNEFDHVWGVSADNAFVTIEKVENDDYMAGHLEDIVDHEELFDLCNTIEEKYEVEPTKSLEHGSVYADKGDYVFQFLSSEKGTFYEGIFETPGLIDLSKLQFIVDEAPNGEDTLYGIEYDGEEVDNNGGDTNGKGYYAYVWEQDY